MFLKQMTSFNTVGESFRFVQLPHVKQGVKFQHGQIETTDIALGFAYQDVPEVEVRQLINGLSGYLQLQHPDHFTDTFAERVNHQADYALRSFSMNEKNLRISTWAENEVYCLVTLQRTIVEEVALFYVEYLLVSGQAAEELTSLIHRVQNEGVASPVKPTAVN